MIRGAHGIGVSVQINPSGATQESLSHPPETHSAPLDLLSNTLFQLFFISWDLNRVKIWLCRRVQEILLFFIKHCSSYCHINCYRFSVQIVFLYCFLLEPKFKLVVVELMPFSATGRKRECRVPATGLARSGLVAILNLALVSYLIFRFSEFWGC